MRVYVVRKQGLLLAGMLTAVLLLCGLAAQWFRLVPGNAAPVPSRLVILDPGHGGIDPGAIGVNSQEEKEINLAISLCLRDILLANGYEVLMTREDDRSVHDPKYKKTAQIKTSDLKNRLKLIREHPDALVISIHQNKFQQESSQGAQMFYGRKNPASKQLAESIQQSFQTRLQPDNTREIKESTSAVYIIHNAENPIVLVECGFLSNYKDCANLCDPEYQKKAAFTIFAGITEYQSGGASEPSPD